MEEKILGELDSASPEAQAAFRKGKLLRERGNTAGALTAYREAAEADPFCLDAHLRIIELLPPSERREIGAEVREGAARILIFGSPDKTETITNLLGQDALDVIANEVITNYQAWLDISPDDFDALYQLSCFFGLRGRDDLFVEGLEKTITAYPDHIEPYLTLYTHYDGADPDRAAEIKRAVANIFGDEGLEALDDVIRTRDTYAARGPSS